jgi:hypothetical protein
MRGAKLSLGLGLVAIIAGFPSFAQMRLIEKEEATIADLQQDVGRRFWIMFPEQKPVVTCPSPLERLDRCNTLRGGSFTVDSISLQHAHSTANGTVHTTKFYLVRFDDGTTGYIPISQRRFFLAQDPKITAEELAKARAAARTQCKEAGEPRINMTKEEVSATCWGSPKRVVGPSGGPSRREYFIYGSGRFLTFENGRLVGIR